MKALKWTDDVEQMFDANLFDDGGYNPSHGCHVEHHGKHYFIGSRNLNVTKVIWLISITMRRFTS